MINGLNVTALICEGNKVNYSKSQLGLSECTKDMEYAS